jgi:hypothetical protein
VSYLMNPEAIIERATARPFIGAGTVKALTAGGWHLVHARHQAWDDDAVYLVPGRVDQFRAIVWGVEEGSLERSVRTSHMVIDRVPHPEGLVKTQRERAWQELALPLGRALGVLS